MRSPSPQRAEANLAEDAPPSQQPRADSREERDEADDEYLSRLGFLFAVVPLRSHVGSEDKQRRDYAGYLLPGGSVWRAQCLPLSRFVWQGGVKLLFCV